MFKTQRVDLETARLANDPFQIRLDNGRYFAITRCDSPAYMRFGTGEYFSAVPGVIANSGDVETVTIFNAEGNGVLEYIVSSEPIQIGDIAQPLFSFASANFHNEAAAGVNNDIDLTSFVPGSTVKEKSKWLTVLGGIAFSYAGGAPGSGVHALIAHITMAGTTGPVIWRIEPAIEGAHSYNFPRPYISNRGSTFFLQLESAGVGITTNLNALGVAFLYSPEGA